MKRFRPLDFVILVLILTAAFFSIKTAATKKGSYVFVQADEKSYQFALSKDRIYKVQGPLGFTTFQIQNQKVRILDSPCSGKTCINQGWHSPLVCLPNKVIITIEDYGEFDAVSE